MVENGDNDRILIRIVPTLAHIASVGVAVPLFLGFSAETLDEVWADIQKENLTIASDLLSDYSRAKTHFLLIPGHLRKAIFYTVKGLREEYIQCQREHPHIEANKCPLILRYDGTIDRNRLALAVVADETVDAWKRFNIAVVYDLRQHIWNLWNKMVESGSRKDIETIRKFYRFKSFNGKMEPCIQIPQDLQKSGIWCWRTSSFVLVSKPSTRRRLLSNLYLLENNDDYLSFVYSITREEQEEVLRKWPTRTLFLFLMWPRQSLFVQMAKRMWNFIDSFCFHSLIDFILQEKINAEDFDYRGLFESFWNESPDHLKESTKDELTLRRRIESYFNEMRKKRKTSESECLGEKKIKS